MSDDEFDEITEKLPRQKLVSDDEAGILSVDAALAPTLTGIPIVETTEREEVEILTIEEVTLAEEV